MDAAVGHARFVLKALAASLLLAFGANIYALPAGGAVAAGSANIASGANTTTVTQSSQNVVINWQSFSIGRGEAVTFVQPSSSSVALNRVMGSDPSSILGSLSANGKVFLVNPNGVLFGTGATVNVGALVASTRNISDADFMAGNYKFAGTGDGTVTNLGSINADGGYVALLGANVSNQGVITARMGTVALAAGNAMTLDVAGDGLLNVTVNQGAVNALISNGGLIQADGGQVLLTAQSAGNLMQSVVNNTGVIRAQTIDASSGTIRLLADMQSGTVNVAGTLDASAPNGGNGGFIETSAATVNVADGTRVTTAAPAGSTGTWLIDPLDYVIAPGGGNITGATLSAQLVNNNITITTAPGVGNGDILVNDAVTWTAAGATTTLTMNASRDVDVNFAITATNGNLVVCCGRDINVSQAITTTDGSMLLSAGRNVNMFATPAALSTTRGNIEICAGHDIDIDGTAITLVNGSLIPSQSLASLGVPLGLTLSAGNDGTGPGTTGGTLIFRPGTPPVAVTGGPGTAAPVTINYNPVSYATPTNYSGNFTLVSSVLTQHMLVFPDGGSKTADGTTTASLSGLKSSPAGVTLVANPGSTASFASSDPGNQTISFTGYTLAGANASDYALPVTCCGVIVGKTTATIVAGGGVPGGPAAPAVPAGPAAPTVQVIPPVLVAAAFPTLGGLNLAVTGINMPVLFAAGPPGPEGLPAEPVVPVFQRPPLYVPPVRPPKHDRG